MNYYMGIDIGSFESKGILMEETGKILASDSQSHVMEIPLQGYAEHDAELVWWREFCLLSKALMKKTGVDPKDIKGVGCSAIGPCCLPVDKQGKPLRKAILYGVDVRAKEQIKRLNQDLGEDYILEKYGNPITSQSVGPKILWIKEHEPEVYEKTSKFITASTYLVAKLTGEYCVDHYTAAYFTPMYNLNKGDWDEENLAQFCRKDQLARCLWTNEIAGGITERAAYETGLAEGTQVTAGTADAAADAVGVGAFHSGDMLTMFGSSLYMIHVVDQLTTDKRYWAGPYLFQNTYMVASGMSTAGTLTRWFRDELAVDLKEEEKKGGRNAYDLLMDAIDGIPAGAEGLVVLPYLSGERTPINDPSARGMIFGLTLQHTRAHLYQACLEGIAYGIAQHLEGYAEIGMKTSRMIVVGGGTKTPKWMQIVADVTGRELLVGGTYGAAFGDALLAAYGTGKLKTLSDMERLTMFNGVVHTDKEQTKRYAPYLSHYKKLYEQTKEIMHELP